MKPQLPKSIPDGADHFGTLPLELNVNIMSLLTLDDLLSLTRASPAESRYFRQDHSFILKSHLRRIYDYFRDSAAIPLLKLLTRLRSLRHRLKGKSRIEVEKQLQPVLDSILFLDFMDIPSGWESNLQALIAANNLIPELRGIFDIWKNRWFQSNTPDKELDKVPRWECWRFVESFLRFECYCCLLYDPEGFLFQDMLQVKHVFLKPLVTATETPLPSDLRPWGLVEDIMMEMMTQMHWKDKRPYPPTEFNFKAPTRFRRWFEPIIKSVDKSLRKEWGRAIKSRNKQAQCGGV
ncbi:hypothetical protein H9Q74_014029 [Fusarium xylarioides]|nr:hypothetical protein H9Q71_011996 [Fusarium xylarioides]KAG5810314.1 hypothetical protein H9Q74_014029 [Fusarium xylarioides]